MRPEDDPGWASYADTILAFPGADPLEIDLRTPPGPDVCRALADRGLCGSFGLVTPQNPRGRRSSSEDNAARLDRFLAQLDRQGARYLLVDGLSRDRQHAERGVALAWSQEDVVALARAWDQSAIYWFDGEHFWVIGALTLVEPWRLGARG
jgi:hypothetical protein